jgi:hypothetical protein
VRARYIGDGPMHIHTLDICYGHSDEAHLDV